jgi:hypothetical protein
MTNPYKLFKTSEDLENKNGVTLDYPGFSITIHRAGGSNKKFAMVMNEKMRPYRRRLETNTLDEELANRLLIEVYAKTVIISWENVQDENDEVMEFSYENCVKLLTDLPELFKDIQDQATNASVFKEEIEALEEKN